MSYSTVNNFLSPLQLGRINKNLILGFQSKFLEVEYDENMTIVIEEDETWEIGKFITGDIIVTEGNRLTITCKVLMPPGGKIIVERGAELYVEGGVITIASRCNDLWQGIVVIGDSDENQLIDLGTGMRKQGYVYLEDATIEYANEAISLYDIDSGTPLNTTGGLVRARNTDFINNTRAVHFKPYYNYNNGWAGNGSWFFECDFIVDDNYTGGNNHEQVLLDGVNGLSFRGCDFENSQDILYSLSDAGIRAIDAGFRVQPHCPTGSPCVPSTFTTLRKGIHVTTACSVFPFVVDQAEFINNEVGILSEGVNNVQITRNTFQIGHWIPEGWGMDVGIFINTGTAYTIEENIFTGNVDFNSAGVVVRETGDDFNQVYKNDYDNLSRANLTNLDNVNEVEPAFGLKYYCNTNQNNDYDFHVNLQGDLFPDRGISTAQGGLSHSAGNTFSFNPNFDESDFLNHSRFKVNYFYYESSASQTPLDYTESPPPGYPNIEVVEAIAVSVSNLCESNFDEGGPNIPDKETQVGTHRQLFDSLDNVRNTLIDGGNTQSLVNTISSPSTTNGGQLKSMLLTISPWLSTEALQATAERTDILSDADIFDVMEANPDESRRESLIQYLENTTDPIPAAMIEDLRELPFTITARTTLESDWAYHFEQVSKAVDLIVQHLYADTTGIQWDSIDYWLQQKGTFASDLQRIDLWLTYGDTTRANQLLSAVPQNYQLSAKQATEFGWFEDMKTLQKTLINRGESILDFESEEVDILKDIADNSVWIAGQQARNILNFAYGHDFIPDVHWMVPGGGSRMPGIAKSTLEKKAIYAFPNPASNMVTFRYLLEETPVNARVQVYDLMGRIKFEAPVAKNRGYVEWHTTRMIEGLYIYTIVNNGKVVGSGQLMIAY